MFDGKIYVKSFILLTTSYRSSSGINNKKVLHIIILPSKDLGGIKRFNCSCNLLMKYCIPVKISNKILHTEILINVLKSTGVFTS